MTVLWVLSVGIVGTTAALDIFSHPQPQLPLSKYVNMTISVELQPFGAIVNLTPFPRNILNGL